MVALRETVSAVKNRGHRETWDTVRDGGVKSKIWQYVERWGDIVRDKM